VAGRWRSRLLCSAVTNVRLSVITPECLRLEFSRTGRFVDAPSVVARHRRPSQVVTSSRIGEVIEVSTPGVRLRFINDGLPFHPGNTRARISPSDAAPFTWRPGDEPRHNLGGTLRTLDGVRGPVDLGQGVLARDGWFLLDDSYSPILVNDWPAPRERVTDPDPDHRDWYLFAYGRDYHAALRSLAALTGPVALPRRALLGSWYSRFWAYSADDYREIVDQYAFHGFGLDVLVLDMDWHKPGWTGWSWNRSLIPDPPALLRWLHERGLTVTLNLHPADGVGAHEDRSGDFMRGLGVDPDSGVTVPFDPADRRYVAALLDTVLAPLRADGVDFWWLDWQQHHFTLSLPSLTNLRQLNRVLAEDSAGGTGVPPVSAVSAEPVAQDLPLAREARIRRRAAILSRWAGWGDHLHPVHFSGDAHGGWTSLAFQIPFTAGAGNVLCCFWSHDIGGHFGLRNDECLARWVQFGAVSPALRLHSAHAAALDRRPWTCAPVFTESMRRAFALRATLMPTIYSAAHRCASDAVPLLRPMYLDHPTERRAYAAPGQFMLGDLLAAPIASPGLGGGRIATQRVWFPASTLRPGGVTPVHAWHDWFTAERFEPGSEALVSAGIDEFPLYAPAGVPILLAEPSHPMGSSRLTTLTVRVYPAALTHDASGTRDAATTLYEDDGDSTAYLTGHAATTSVHARWSDRGVRITIDPVRGAFAGQPSARGYVVELPATVAAPDGARVDGAPVAIELTPGSTDLPPTCRVRLPPRAVSLPTVIEVDCTPADAALVAANARLRRLRDALGEPAPESTVREAVVRLGREARGGVLRAVGLDDALAIAAGLGVRADVAGYVLIDSLGLADLGRFTVTITDELAGARRAVRETIVAVARGRALAIDDPYPPLAEPPLGVRASRFVRAQFTSRAEPMAFETRVRTRLTPVRRWRIAGPFPFDDGQPIAAQNHAPERGLPVRWRDIATDELTDGFNGRYAVDLSRHADPGDRLYYALATLRAPRDLDATLELESADRLEAWLNGEKVFSMDPGEAVDSSRGSPRVALLTGPNELLLKVTRGGGGFGFTVALDAGEVLDDHPA